MSFSGSLLVGRQAVVGRTGEREREREREKEDGYLLLMLIVLLQTRICQKVIIEKSMIPCMAVENKEKHRM
jgi:hypothetical protein